MRRAACSATRDDASTGARDLVGTPVGQIVGSMTAVRPARQVIYEMVEEYIETVARDVGCARRGGSGEGVTA